MYRPYKPCVLFPTLSLLCLLGAPLGAQTVRPDIASASPSGGRRGTTVELTLTGVHIGQGTGLVFEGSGLTVESVTGEKAPDNAKNPNGKLVAKIHIAPDAEPGVRAFRVVTPQGVSDTALFVVGQWAELAEKEPNNTPEAAQETSAPATVSGKLEPGEDVDCFRIKARAGQILVCEVLAARLGAPLDSVLTLQDAGKHEVAINEDFNGADSLIAYTVPKDGDYVLTLRDLSYRGGGDYAYRLTLGAIPYVTAIFPMGGQPGVPLDMALEGFNLGDAKTQRVTLPNLAPGEPFPLTLSLPGGASNPILVAVGDTPEMMEAEPNDRATSPQNISVPGTVNGRILAARAASAPDMDYYRFQASAGQKLVLEVWARRLGSRLDSLLSVQDANGKELAANDDAIGKDSRLEFTAPQAGSYLVRVTDLSGQQGANQFYRLSLRALEPDFRLTFTPDSPAVGQGGRIPFTVMAERLNGFDGDIAVEIAGLPSGVNIIGTPQIGKGKSEAALALSANSDAPLTANALTITGFAKVGGKTLQRQGKPRIETYVKEGDQIQRRLNPARLPMAAVAAAPDIVVSATPETIALSPGKSVEVTVKITRKAGFEAKVPLVVMGLPAGVTATTPEIPEKQAEAKITLKADDKIVPGDIRLLIIARVVQDELRHVPHAALPLTLSLTK
jgi:hypothetical protein